MHRFREIEKFVAERKRLLREDNLVRLLTACTDLLLYALALRIAGLSIVHQLSEIPVLALERDRFIAIFVFGVTSLLFGCYDSRRLADRFDAVYYTMVSLIATTLLLFALATLAPPGWRVISRREMALSLPVGMVLLFVWRFFVSRWLTGFPSLHRHIYILAEPQTAAHIAEAIKKDTSVRAEPVPLTWEEFENDSFVDAQKLPRDIIVEVNPHTRTRLTHILTSAQRFFEQVYLYPSLDELLLFDLGRVTAISGIPLVSVATFSNHYPYVYIKRMLDIVLAAAGLIISLPITIPTAIAVKITSPGPIFYKQERLGKGGKPFTIYKFRSMVNGDVQKTATGYALATADDPRITPVGRFIRKHRIDEIPQLYNVLRGDMSLIGPRPVWREFYDAHRAAEPLIDLRLCVKPGLTCLSHTLGHYESEMKDRLRYDLVYISTLSLATDLKIMFDTIRIVLSGRGAQ